MFGIILLTQPWTRLSWIQSSLGTLCKRQQRLGEAFCGRRPGFSENTSGEVVTTGCEWEEEQGRRNISPCRENPGMCRGKGSGRATAPKWQSRKMLFTAFWARDEHRAAQFVKGSEKTLQAFWVRARVGDLAVWMATKSLLGQGVRDNPLDWHNLNTQTWKEDAMTKNPPLVCLCFQARTRGRMMVLSWAIKERSALGGRFKTCSCAELSGKHPEVIRARGWHFRLNGKVGKESKSSELSAQMWLLSRKGWCHWEGEETRVCGGGNLS